MKRIVAILLCLIMLFAFAGCGEDEKTDDKKESGRILYNNVKLDKYVKLGDYKKITVDTSTEDFKKIYDSMLESDVKNNDFYVKKTEGTIAKGDNVNMDYSGKKDGIAFDGGTAKDQFLVIGSGQFIPGFEDGLIGVEIGSTVDLNLKFPDNYSNSPELAGAAVVFTVKVNYVKTEEALSPDVYYKQLGFASADAYYSDVKKRAVEDYLLTKVLEDASVSDYPKAELEKLVKISIEQNEYTYKMQYGMDIETLLSYSGQTMEEFEKNITENYVKPLMKEQMVLYSILDKQNLKVTSAEVDKRIDEKLDDYKKSGTTVTKEQLISVLGEFYFESLIVSEKVSDYLCKNAEIK